MDFLSASKLSGRIWRTGPHLIWPSIFSPWLADVHNHRVSEPHFRDDYKVNIMDNTIPPAALSDLRVLDLTDLKGALCAKLLGDMGADVIKIEPPGGDAMRTVGPFLDGRPHCDRSLLFWFYNTSKRGLTLDVHQPAGQEIFKQ